jgi:hypothetical protein
MIYVHPSIENSSIYNRPCAHVSPGGHILAPLLDKSTKGVLNTNVISEEGDLGYYIRAEKVKHCANSSRS